MTSPHNESLRELVFNRRDIITSLLNDLENTETNPIPSMRTLLFPHVVIRLMHLDESSVQLVLSSATSNCLTNEAIRRLPRVRASSLPAGEGCTICLEPFKQRQQIISVGCEHVFHRHCLTQWLTRKDTCPNCRAKVQVPAPRYLLRSHNKFTSDSHVN